jgi:hypothetical protein
MSACAWLESSLRRVYPASPARDATSLTVCAARNDRASFQVCVRNSSTSAVRAEVAVEPGCEGLAALVRRVGMVAMAHLNTDTPADECEGSGYVPGLAPDPLYPEQAALVGPSETAAFWVSLSTARGMDPGAHDLLVRTSIEGQPPAEMRVTLLVGEPAIDLRKPFWVTHWFYADALCDWYGVEPFSEAFWPICRRYMTDHASHGGSSQYVPIFTPPTDGVKRPTQLLRVSEPTRGRYEFDFTDVDRWVATARKAGASYFEWTHLFSQWGVKHALRVYRDNADPASLLWPASTGAVSPIYRRFLAQFLPRFHAFLSERKLLDVSLFHVSDEQGLDHLESYRSARAMLRDLAPWLRSSDALSNLEFGKLGLVDIPIPSISESRAFAEAGIPAWAYFCCGPRGRFVNRLMDTPLVKIRSIGWLLHRFEAGGFLHWGYNYWYRSQSRQLVDPFSEQAGGAWPGWPYGDPFVVYPGPQGPLDSIRWEVFADGLRDQALLRTLGSTPADALLAPLQGYDRFPRDAAWLLTAKRRLLGL